MKLWKRTISWIRTGALAITVVTSQLSPLAFSIAPTATAATTGPNVVINEIMPNPTSGNEWVELYNAGDTAQDLTGWSIRDESDNYVGTNSSGLSGSINPGEYRVFDTNGAARLNNDGDSAILKDDAGSVVDSVSYTDAESGETYGIRPTGGEIWFLESAVSKGTANVCLISNGSWCSAYISEAFSEVESGETLEILSDITVTERPDLSVDGVTIDGNGNTIFASYPKTGNSNNAALGVFGDNVVIQNLNLDGTGSLPWPEQLHGINTYKITNLLLDSVSVTNFSGSGIVVNGSTVTVRNIVTSGNIWHGINVDQGSGVTEPAVLTVEGISTQTDDLHIYLDKAATADVTVNDVNDQYGSVENVLKAGDRLYRLKPSTPTGLTIIDHLGNDLQCGGYTNNRSVTVDWNDNPASEGVVEYQYDVKDRDDILRPTDSEFSGNIRDEDGLYRYRVRAVDGVGIVGEPSEWCEVTLDRSAPSTPSVVSPTPRKWFKASPIRNEWTESLDETSGVAGYQIAYQYDDGHSFGGSTCDQEELTIGDPEVGFVGCRNLTGISRNHTPSLNEQGGVTIWIRAYDKAGNYSEWSDSVHYYYDHENPVTSIEAPTGLVGNSFKISGLAEDNLALNRVYVQLVNREDNKRYGGTTIHLIGKDTPFQWSNTFNAEELSLPDGRYAVHASVTDMAGNTGNTGWTDDFTIDTQKPRVRLSDISDGDWITSDTDLAVTLDDLGGSPLNGDLEIQVMSGLESVPGVYSTDSRIYATTEPYDPADSTYTFTLSDLVDLDDGLYRIRVITYDQAGNRSRHHRYVYVDNSTPQISSVSVQGSDVEDSQLRIANCEDIKSTTKVSGDLDFSAAISDEISGVASARYRIRKLNDNGCTVSNVYSSGQMNLEYDSEADRWMNTASFDTRTLEDGVYTIMIITRDEVGNQSVTYADIEVDNTIAGVVGVTENVSTLKAALEAVELLDTFGNEEGEETYTVFAPVNSAFDGFDIDELLANPELTTILTYHVVGETVLAAALSDGQEITTLSGKKLFVVIDETGTYLEDENGGTVRVVQTDIQASNGVIHLIESVLLPNDQGPEAAGIDGTPLNDDETEYAPGAEIVNPEGTEVEVTKDGESYVYDPETGLTEPGDYDIITVDRFGRRTTRRITIVEPVTLSPEPSDNQDSDQNSESDPSDNQDSDQSTTLDEQGDPTLEPIALGGGTGDAPAATPAATGTPIAQAVTTDAEDTPEETLEESESPESDQTEDTEESIEDGSDGDNNGLVANIGSFIGGWFSTWWGWLISILIVLFLIIAGYRRRKEQR